jgi:hypothetical protein
MKDASKSAKASASFSEVEMEAMKAKIAEEKAARRKGAKKGDGEQDVLAAIAAMTGSDRTLAERIHAIVKASAPGLSSKTWYGMPAYADADGKVVCFFQSAAKFKVRYATFGFNEAARLDDGNLWPTAFALTRLTAADEAAIAALVKRAVG